MKRADLRLGLVLSLLSIIILKTTQYDCKVEYRV